MTNEYKKILIAGSILLVIALIYRFYPATGTLFNSTSDIELKTKMVSKYSGIVNQRKEIDKHIALLKDTFRVSSKALLNGRTSALAGVDIQNVINKIAQEVGIRIDRVDVKKKNKLGNKHPDKNGVNILTNISVRFRIVSTVEQLQKFIYRIESAKKFLRIVNLKAKVRRVKYPEQIIADVIVEGFVLASNK